MDQFFSFPSVERSLENRLHSQHLWRGRPLQLRRVKLLIPAPKLGKRVRDWCKGRWLSWNLVAREHWGPCCDQKQANTLGSSLPNRRTQKDLKVQNKAYWLWDWPKSVKPSPYQLLEEKGCSIHILHLPLAARSFSALQAGLAALAPAHPRCLQPVLTETESAQVVALSRSTLWVM